MDPLTAISLVGNMIQFLDFGIKVVSAGLELKKSSGTTESIANLEARTIAFNNTASQIISLEQSTEPLADYWKDIQGELIETCRECQSLSTELFSLIDDLKLPKKHSPLSVIVTASRNVWSRNRVNALEHLLTSSRAQLTIQLLVLISIHIRQDKSSVHQALEEQNSSVLQALREQKDRINEITYVSQGQRQAADSRIEDSDSYSSIPTALLRHNSGMTTVLSLEDGSQTMIASGHNFGEPGVTIFSGESNGDLTSSYSDLKELRARMLDYLFFDAMGTRQYDITPAHDNTFQWIYETPQHGETWDDFSEWLAQESGCYWINGKAGSGKSTLMKYISQQSYTKEILWRWAGDTKLVSAAYYSWNLGLGLQKTLEGMLRTLLHDVLTQVPELILVVLSEKIRALARSPSTQVTSHDPPRYKELKRWFQLLVEQCCHSFKLCIMIDGIDEFEGDHADVCALLKSFISPHIKVIVSSRPIPACVEAFYDCKQLRLQDLTNHDMAIYAEELLHAHRRFEQHLTASEQKSLRMMLVEKAEGVFLWITLATASLRDGLDSFDDFDELMARMEQLPSDLKELYQHMLQRLPSQYRHQASEILQVVLHQTGTSKTPLSTFEISFLTNTKTIHASDEIIGPLTYRDFQTLHERTEGRLRSRCWGLVEVRADGPTNTTEAILSTRVSFIHRTVAEYLRSEGAQTDILGPSSSKDFSSGEVLAKLYLSPLRAAIVSPNFATTIKWYQKALTTFFEFCSFEACVSETFYYDAMDLLNQILSDNKAFRFINWSSLIGEVWDHGNRHVFELPVSMKPSSVVLIFNVAYMLIPYMDHIFSHSNKGKSLRDPGGLLQVLSWLSPTRKDNPEDVLCLDLLLKCGADPNEIIEGYRASLCSLVFTAYFREILRFEGFPSMSRFGRYFDYIETLAAGGADPYTSIAFQPILNRHSIQLPVVSCFELYLQIMECEHKRLREVSDDAFETTKARLEQILSRLRANQEKYRNKSNQQKRPRARSLPELPNSQYCWYLENLNSTFVSYVPPLEMHTRRLRSLDMAIHLRTSTSYGPANPL